VRTGFYASAVIAAVILAGRELAPKLDVITAGLAQDWWILPFSASASSVAVLATTTALRIARNGSKRTAILTGAYLVSGPSMATLGISSVLPFGASPPAWVGSAMLVLLFGSAWVYYQSLGDSDEEDSSDFRPESGSLNPLNWDTDPSPLS